MLLTAEQARYELNKGHLWLRVYDGRYLRLRAAGATQTWKRDPHRYRIRVKTGIGVYSEITDTTEIETYRSCTIIHSTLAPNLPPRSRAVRLPRKRVLTPRDPNFTLKR